MGLYSRSFNESDIPDTSDLTDFSVKGFEADTDNDGVGTEPNPEIDPIVAKDNNSEIDEAFIEFLDESYMQYSSDSEVRDAVNVINNMIFKEDVSTDDIYEVLAHLEAAENLSFDTLKTVVNRLNEAVNIINEEKTILVDGSRGQHVNSSVSLKGAAKAAIANMKQANNIGIQDFSGDPQKNQEYIDLLGKMEKFVNEIADTLQLAANAFDKNAAILKKMVKEKDENKNRKYILEMKGIVEKTISVYNNYWNADGRARIREFELFKTLSRTFNNRYSTITMEEKKVIDKKLNIVINANFTIAKDYIAFQNSPAPKKWNDMARDWQDVSNNNDSNGRETATCVNILYRIILGSFRDLITVAYTVKKFMDIDLERSAKYRIIQTILKK